MTHRIRFLSLVTLTVGSLCAACSGTLGEAGPSDDVQGQGPRGGTGGTTPEAKDLSAGQMPLRRLTRVEYENTVRDLFGFGDFQAPLEPDPVGAFGFAEAPLVVEQTGNALIESSLAIAERAVTKLATLLPCSSTAGAAAEDACARELATNFGRRVYRRPVPESEVTELMSLYSKVRQDQADFKEAAGLVIAAMLQSPRFLYHWELGGDRAVLTSGLVKLSGYEVASRLSYFLWGSMPDDALFAAAAAGSLDTADGVAKAADRLMKSERFAASAQSFHAQWLEIDRVAGISKDEKLHPEFDDALKEAMITETKLFVQDVFTSGDGKLTSLLRSNKTRANGPLAKLYGVTGPTGTAFEPVTLDPRQRAGLLTQPGFLSSLSNAGDTNPARAGRLILERFLCQSMEPAPPEVVQSFKFDDTLSTRGNFERLEKSAGCDGCHKVINPIGYAFERYDAIGKWRTDDSGQPLDNSGAVITDAGRKPFKDLVEMAGILADDASVQACVARTWLRFGLGRSEAAGDKRSLDDATTAFGKGALDVRLLLKAMVTSSAFRFRKPEIEERL